MKRFIACALIMAIILALVGCTAEPEKEVSDVTSEVVEAIVVGAYTPYRGTPQIEVVYKDTVTRWVGREYYDRFATNVGFYVRCILMTYSYKDGSTTRKLIFNEDIFNGGEIK